MLLALCLCILVVTYILSRRAKDTPKRSLLNALYVVIWIYIANAIANTIAPGKNTGIASAFYDMSNTSYHPDMSSSASL